MRVSFRLLVAALFSICTATTSFADEPATGAAHPTNEANNPLTPKITLNVQDYYIPSFNHSDREANQLLLRGLVPSDLFGVPQLLRFTLPVLVTAPSSPSDYDNGIGDLTLMDLLVFPSSIGTFGAGPLLVIPTAAEDTLGTGKWQAGVAGVYVAPQSWGLIGGLATYQQSFAGDSSRQRVQNATLQPILFYNLPDAFYLRSSGTWTFDLENNSYYMPVGFGVGRVFPLSGGVTLNAYVEPQYSVFHDDSVGPRWQIFAGINLQFPIGK